MATLFDTGIFSVAGSNGGVAPGALLHFYVAGTATETNTYTASDLATPNSNPVAADANGRFPAIWLPAGNFKYTLTQSDGTGSVTRDGYVSAAASPTIDAGLTSFLAGSAALPIANGGTGQTSAANALSALGALPAAGGTVTGNITRSTKGVHIYWNTAAMANGGFFLTSSATADPRGGLPGQIWAKY